MLENFNCQICGSDKFKVLDHEYFRGNKFEYAICKKCSFVSQGDLYYTDKFLKLPYQTQGNYDEHSKNRANYIYEFSKDHIGRDIDVFDIGCSMGGTMKYFKELVADANISGCTILSDGEKIISSDLKIINKDFNEIFFTKKYDFIIMSHVLEHFIDVRETLQKVQSIMKKDSVTYIEVPWIDYLNVRIPFEFCPEHISYFTPHSLKNLLLTEGFEILKITSSKYWGNIKVLISKRQKEKTIFVKNKLYLLYMLERYCRKATHWFYRFMFKCYKIKPNS